MRALLAAALTLAPVMAQAQEVSYDEGLLIECLQSHDEGARTECIGLASGACIEASEGGETTVGMTLCLAEEYDSWDALLNAVYSKLMAVEKAADTEAAELGMDAPKMADALKSMQRAWIAFRDTSCAYEVSQWGYGTGAGPANQGCMMDMTARQALELISRLDSKDL